MEKRTQALKHVRASLPTKLPLLPLLLTELQIRPVDGSASTHRQSIRRRRLRPVPAPQRAGPRVATADRQTELALRPGLTRRRLHLHAPAEDKPPTPPAGTGARDHRTSHPANTKLNVMAASGQKSANWTNRDDEKLLDVLIEQRAQGAVKFEWSLVRVMLKYEGIHKESVQIKNRCNDLRKKLGAWEYLIGRTGVGVDYTTGAVQVSDSAWEEFLQRYGGKYKSFRKKVPANLDKMKSAFHGKQATGEMSFAPGMVGSPSNQT
ncbi:hypothetical protein Cgig2_000963 [Carnegiea gigantea]|uniref:Myb/SANT-like domain-containing protein n=1 Tax=Carnegiea gigantea TaxID=171969 RepID=A0A9Q1QK97_9CARY|nr:hypothetical protein Cgig2_000963 [Carnegiea gigantea]